MEEVFVFIVYFEQNKTQQKVQIVLLENSKAEQLLEDLNRQQRTKHANNTRKWKFLARLGPKEATEELRKKVAERVSSNPEQNESTLETLLSLAREQHVSMCRRMGQEWLEYGTAASHVHMFSALFEPGQRMKDWDTWQTQLEASRKRNKI